MKIIIKQIATEQWKQSSFVLDVPMKAQWIIVLASRDLLSRNGIHQELAAVYPEAVITYCSTADEIVETTKVTGQYSLAFIGFQHTTITAVSSNTQDFSSDYELGKYLIKALPKASLSHVFLLADGQIINGSALLKGVRSETPEHVKVSGGMAGDGDLFEETRVGLNDDPVTGEVVAVGLYGDKLIINTGNGSGFGSFGVDRKVTKAKENELFELDGQSALDLYKKYLGPLAEQLPGSSLLFPLLVKEGEERHLVRTILSIDEKKGSMTFAGDVPQGAYARLMHTNSDRLIDAAHDAAQQSRQNKPASLAFIVSCVGRKLVLGQRVEEELEAVKEELGAATRLFGFYSYGEICPRNEDVCELYNQTMTITTISEDLS